MNIILFKDYKVIRSNISELGDLLDHDDVALDVLDEMLVTIRKHYLHYSNLLLKALLVSSVILFCFLSLMHYVFGASFILCLTLFSIGMSLIFGCLYAIIITDGMRNENVESLCGDNFDFIECCVKSLDGGKEIVRYIEKDGRKFVNENGCMLDISDSFPSLTVLFLDKGTCLRRTFYSLNECTLEVSKYNKYFL